MAAEAGPMIEHMGLTRTEVLPAHSPAVVHSGEYSGCTVSVVQPGKCKRTGVDNVSEWCLYIALLT
jgi:hypothetical protein